MWNLTTHRVTPSLFGSAKSVMTVMRFSSKTGEREREGEQEKWRMPRTIRISWQWKTFSPPAVSRFWRLKCEEISASIIFHQVKSTRLQRANHSIDNCETLGGSEWEKKGRETGRVRERESWCTPGGEQIERVISFYMLSPARTLL